jgi:hypothetical protein
MKTHTDGIWISAEREKQTVKELTEHILSCGYSVVTQNEENYGYPYEFVKGDTKLSCRIVDTVNYTDITVTDNHSTVPIDGVVHSILPEFWSQWRFDPQYIDRPATYGYNCFMGRIRPERDRVFDILKRQKILECGLVSYFENNIYDTVNSHGTLEQCIIDSNISLVLETYTLDTNIVFSEKIFRALQLPRPWLLYCSPLSIQLLKTHGFDVLADYVNHEYDTITNHWQRMDIIIKQLETFIDKQYTRRDYERFEQAATHNQTLLYQFARDWSITLDGIKLYISTPGMDWSL